MTSTERFETTTKDNSPCIYAIRNNDNFRTYIGQTKTPVRRATQHSSGLRAGTHPNKRMQEDYNKGDSFTFYRIMSYSEEDESETMRYYELKNMGECRNKGIELYNSETDADIKKLLYFNSNNWEMRCLMETKRDEYYKKYFGCTYNQFRAWDMLSKEKGRDDFLPWKIERFNEKRMKEIEKEERQKRKDFLKEHKKISFYIKKDIYEKLESITSNPEEYINMIIENFMKQEEIRCQ